MNNYFVFLYYESDQMLLIYEPSGWVRNVDFKHKKEQCESHDVSYVLHGKSTNGKYTLCKYCLH